jgi:hypothetical protein
VFIGHGLVRHLPRNMTSGIDRLPWVSLKLLVMVKNVNVQFFHWKSLNAAFAALVKESGALNIEKFRPISFVGSVFKLLIKDR